MFAFIETQCASLAVETTQVTYESRTGNKFILFHCSSFSLLLSPSFSLLASIPSSLFSRQYSVLSFLSCVSSLLAVLLCSSYCPFSTSLFLWPLFFFQVFSIKEERWRSACARARAPMYVCVCTYACVCALVAIELLNH